MSRAATVCAGKVWRRCAVDSAGGPRWGVSRVHDTILRCRINAAFRSQVERCIYAAEWVREEICPAPLSNRTFYRLQKL